MRAAIGVLGFVGFAEGGGCVFEVFGGGLGEIGSPGVIRRVLGATRCCCVVPRHSLCVLSGEGSGFWSKRVVVAVGDVVVTSCDTLRSSRSSSPSEMSWLSASES